MRNGILHSYTIIYWPKAKKDGLCMIFTCKKPKEEKKKKKSEVWHHGSAAR